jgi:spore maturation protein CgeB
MTAAKPLDIVILGLSITSSWGNGHATTFRGLIRELAARGHRVLFLERDVPWYSSNRDLANPEYCTTELYTSLDDLKYRFSKQVQEADLVIVGSYVPEGVSVGQWVIYTAQGIKAFYDIDTPVTLAKLQRNDFEYLHPNLIPQYDLYLSFTGGPTLGVLEREYGSPMARPLYCSFDPALYYPEEQETQWDLGYLGTYSDDRQPPLEKLMLDAARKWPAGKFVVAGPQYPDWVRWPANTQYIHHLPPAEHRRFYNQQRFTQNITRQDMIRAGYSPSVRLFEAAACAIPIISDYWDGLDSLFTFDSEILISRNAQDTLSYLQDIPEPERKAIGERARQKVMATHTAAHRALEVEQYVRELQGALNLKN